MDTPKSAPGEEAEPASAPSPPEPAPPLPPVASEVRGAAPPLESAAPEAKPAEPTNKPAAPAAKLAEPTNKPAAPEANAAESTDKGAAAETPAPASTLTAEPVVLGSTRVEREYLDLLKDAKTGKRKHFHAAQRKQQWHTRFGISALILTSMAAIVSAMREYVPETLVGLIGTALPAIAAVLVGLQTFLRLEKMVEGHRSIANEYLRLHRNGMALYARRLDGRMSIDELDASFDEYRLAYHKLNKDSEAFATDSSDLAAARRTKKTSGEAPGDPV